MGHTHDKKSCLVLLLMLMGGVQCRGGSVDVEERSNQSISMLIPPDKLSPTSEWSGTPSLASTSQNTYLKVFCDPSGNSRWTCIAGEWQQRQCTWYGRPEGAVQDPMGGATVLLPPCCSSDPPSGFVFTKDVYDSCPTEYPVSDNGSLYWKECQKVPSPNVDAECAKESPYYMSYDYSTTDAIYNACVALWNVDPSLLNDAGIGREIRCRSDSHELGVGQWVGPPRIPVCDDIEKAAASLNTGDLKLSPGCGLYFWCTDPELGKSDIQWVMNLEQTYDF